MRIKQSMSLKTKKTLKIIKIECVTDKPDGENFILVKGRKEQGRFKTRRINKKYRMVEISLNFTITAIYI